MQRFKNIQWISLLMALTITATTAFQLYWLAKAYDREKRTLAMRTNLLFRETVRSVQASKMKLDRFMADTSKASKNSKLGQLPARLHEKLPKQKMEGVIDVVMQKIKSLEGSNKRANKNNTTDTAFVFNKGFSGRRNRLLQFLFDLDSLQDSIRIHELQINYARHLKEQNLSIPFQIIRVPTHNTEDPVFNEVTVGFSNPITYRLDLGNTNPFLMKRISVPILFSFFLVAFSILTFLVLYKNILKQNRLANIKNEFISNITHELKTPIATVSVAIEALRNFNENADPLKTKEYLDISANELQRLSLLVDKVLKLSMFEKKEVDFKYELLETKELVEEVTSSMRLQFEKQKAILKISSEGDTTLQGDRLHLLSILFNLLDNALKYSPQNPNISILLKGGSQFVYMSISDAGIGIPSEYQGKIFEKFFRVPKGNLHNAKGYGLGLSYVAHVVNRHHGTIKVESEEGRGSKFIISLPRIRV
ncbi:MAG: hypothetical protein NVS9B7_15730 [Flavisolibacter sp.]